MANTQAAAAATKDGGFIDLTEPPGGTVSLNEVDEPVDPLSSLSSLASGLDSYYDDIPAFLNSILAPHLPPSLPAAQQLPPDLAPIDKQLSELLTRLSLLSQDTSSALEQSINDISRTVPRLTYDLQFMRESAVSLQSSLSLVQDRVARQAAGAKLGAGADTDEARTHRSLDKLAHLDKLKTRMESARDILAEAESWSTLEGEITAFISDKQWTRAGERLAEAQKSLVVFQSAEGEYESKRSLLVSLQNELETALSAALKDAIARVDTLACAQFHDIFRMMDRGHEFQNYYFAARRAPIVDEWAGANLVDADGKGQATPQVLSPTRPSMDLASPTKANAGETFSVFLPRFFNTVISTLTAERAQIPLIFPTEAAGEILESFFQSTMDELSPSFHSRLSSVAEHHGAEALPEIIRAFRTTEENAVAVQSIMDKLAFNTQGGLVSGHADRTGSISGNSGIAQSPSTYSPSSPSHAPRLSRLSSASAHGHTTTQSRMSISHRFSRNFSLASELPSSPSSWETALFEPFLDLQTDYPALEKRYLSHLLATEPAINGPVSKDDPSRTLNERASAVFSIAEDAINRCMALTHGYAAIGLADALNGFIHDFLTSNSEILENARAAAKGSSGREDELDFEGLEYSTEDWGAFQLGLHVLTACRGMRDRLAAFEKRLGEAVENIAPILAVSASDPATWTRTDTTLGAITLLQQSTLNSAALHALTSEPHALPRARDALSSFTRTSQVFLQGIILSPLQAQLAGYPALACWTAPEKAPKRGELHIPSFSLSPTDTIARVAEGLLNLLRVFEVYAADDALAFSIETLPFVDVDFLRELTEGNAQEAKRDAAAALAASGTGSGANSPSPAGASPAPVPLPATPGPTPLTAEAVLSTWVSSLALSLLSHLTRTTLPAIAALTTPGAAQLASDLAYLSNAVRALDVEWDDLERWREAAECKDRDEWVAKGGEERGKGVWGVVGMLRGWS